MTGAIDRALDIAVRLPAAGVSRRVDRLRTDSPRSAPADVLRRLEKEYLGEVSRIGGAVGATAAVPGLGTIGAIGLTGVQVAEFLTDSSRFVMAVADLHGIPIDDVERRRALLLATLLGEEGAAEVQLQLAGQGTSVFWARNLLTKLPLGSVRGLTDRLRGMVLRQTARSGGRIALGRLLPFGVGAVIGFAGARRLGKQVVEGAQLAFGPAPATFHREIGEVARVAHLETLSDTPAGPEETADSPVESPA